MNKLRSSVNPKYLIFLVIAVLTSIGGCDNSNECNNDNNTTEDNCRSSGGSHYNNRYYNQNSVNPSTPKPKYGFFSQSGNGSTGSHSGGSHGG